MVADSSEALVGGINIADKYRGTSEEAAWLDFAVRISGPLCVDLSLMCKAIHGKKSTRTPKKSPETASEKKSGSAARVALNDWWRRKNQVSAGYRAAFRNAQESIFIVASYFLPSRGVRTALKNASKRGVKITVLLPGKLDLPMAKRATRYLYRWLSRNKIDIYEWGESVLHGKIAVVDNIWSTVGSYNLNHLSEYSSIETNVEVLDKKFAASVHKTLDGLIKQCNHIPADSFNSRGLINKFLDWISYILGRWFMLFLFFLIARGNRYKTVQ
jgi:cardiolipin synthase